MLRFDIFFSTILLIIFFSGCSLKSEENSYVTYFSENKFGNLITDLEINKKIDKNQNVNFVSCKEHQTKEKDSIFVINKMLEEKLVDNGYNYTLNKTDKTYNVICNYNVINKTIIIYLYLNKNDVVLSNSNYFYLMKQSPIINSENSFRTMNVIKE